MSEYLNNISNNIYLYWLLCFCYLINHLVYLDISCLEQNRRKLTFIEIIDSTQKQTKLILLLVVNQLVVSEALNQAKGIVLKRFQNNIPSK